jgi:hypothetical protein
MPRSSSGRTSGSQPEDHRFESDTGYYSLIGVVVGSEILDDG